MPTAPSLQQRVLAVIQTPMTFGDIESAVGRQPPLVLGLCLARLVLAGRIGRKDPSEFSSRCPVYFAGRLPRGFVHPLRRVG